MRSADAASASRPKATLFCQTCGHESPIEGDWNVRSTTARTVTRCPNCRKVIDDRPTHEQPCGASQELSWSATMARVKHVLGAVGASMALSSGLLDPRP